MRTAARLALAFVLVLGVAVVLPRPASTVFAPDAHAQLLPTPTLPGLGVTPAPLPPPPGGGGGGDDDDDGGGSGSGSGGGKGGGSGSKAGSGGGSGSDAKAGDATRKKRNQKKKKKAKLPIFEGTYVPGGKSFTTNQLVAAASQLRSLGLSADEVISQVYPPFIIGGRAAWQNTWGAPRYGPGPIVRQHEGQDVFCNYGDPVLAPEAGLVSYSDGGLGGTTARVHVSSSEYWYLTHLSETNELEYPTGTRVEAGDVVGFCGNSGNAITTPPHVHFGWYVDGVAQNPHRTLVQWLRAAEDHVATLLAQTQNERVEQIDRLTLARRFGDTFTPGIASLQVAGESLSASGSSPAGSALSLAEAALQAALSRGDLDASTSSVVSAERLGAGTGSTPLSGNRLSALMRTASFYGDEHNHD